MADCDAASNAPSFVTVRCGQYNETALFRCGWCGDQERSHPEFEQAFRAKHEHPEVVRG